MLRKLQGVYVVNVIVVTSMITKDPRKVRTGINAPVGKRYTVVSVSSKQVVDWNRFFLTTSTMFSMLNGLFVNLI